MKKYLSLFVTFVLVFGSLSSYAAMSKDDVIDHYIAVTEGRQTDFSDISDYPWAVKPISFLAARGIVNGIGDGMFAPQKTLTRYEFIKMIVGVCGLTDEDAISPCSDVDSTHWCYKYVSSAYSAGILDIYSKVILNGTAAISREEIAYISVAALKKGGFIEDTLYSSTIFTDEDEMSNFSPDAISTLCALGVINGRGDGTFAPKDSATRAEASKIIYNILNIIEENF